MMPKRIRVVTAAAVVSLFLGMASQALADGPVCYPKTLVIAESPDSAANIVVNPIDIAPACMDATSHQLTLTSVTAPASLNPAAPGFQPNTMTIANDLAVC